MGSNNRKISPRKHKFNPIQDGFSTVASTNLEIIPKNVWFLVLIFFRHWCKTSRSYLAPVPNYKTWTKNTPQKSGFTDHL